MITLDEAIESELKNPEFAKHYQRELLANAIATMVVQLRQAAHLTQSELAKKAGTTQPVIARLEKGTEKRIPSLELLTRIATASNSRLNISFEKPNQS